MLDRPAGLAPDISHGPALDLINTFARRGRRTVDLLADPKGVLDLVATDLAPAPGITETRRLHGQAIELRRALRALLVARRSGSQLPSESVFVLDRLLGTTPVVTRVRTVEGRLVATEEPVGNDGPSRLHPLAKSGLALLTRVDPRRLRPCDEPTCPLWFVDTSKNGRRRWCSMETCGNRAKARRHRSK